MNDAQSIAVCHVVASINEHTGGPAVSVPAICTSLLGERIVPTLFCLNYPGAGPELRPEGVRVVSIAADKLAVRARGYSPKARRALKEIARNADCVHNHGLWMAPNRYARLAASAAGIPLIISPRGMLEAWSMRNSAWKKQIAWSLYERRNLESAAGFHATSLRELESIRGHGFCQPVAVIPNGVTLPDKVSGFGRDLLEHEHPELADKRWLLFMSRLHPKKGLDLLLECWREIESQFAGWQLLIAGADAPDYVLHFQRMAERLGIKQRVTFTGNLSGGEKSAALANAQLFILPTHSENFGIVIAEALAHETPVITTHGAPWSGVAEHKCGWWIPLTGNSLQDTLVHAMHLPDEERAEMGRRGRRYVANDYSWSSVARQMAAFYRWLLDRGERPSCVDE